MFDFVRLSTRPRSTPSILPLFAMVSSICGTPALALDSGKVTPEKASQVDPLTHPASDAAAKAAPFIRIPDQWKLDLYAAEPLLSDPVAMNFDEQGRLYMALHHRNRHGTEDTREHSYWRKEDQASKTLDDRLNFMKRWADAGKVPMSYYTDLPERIICIEDQNGDGVADTSREVAKFQDPLDGVNAGVLVRNGNVWATCIPHLWHFKDNGKETQQATRLLTGFGTKFTFHGHDMHGLVFGPDGRIYWSIGDRGYHVTDREGRLHADAEGGAVFRSEPDGSKMEVFATGLRNPQELVFDDLGNLITVDNDNDAEDNPRLLNVLQGGDYGWRNGNLWQDDTLPTFSPQFRRPWYGDKIYETRFPGQPAYVQPALGFITNGPCGLAREPGSSLLPDPYRGCFLITDWRGGRVNSPVIAFWLKADGMNFSISKQEDLITGTLPTDVTFGPDGRLYLADMVESRKQPNGGNRNGRGWIWAITPPSSEERKQAALQVKQWLASGFAKETDITLLQRLRHEDYRVRLEAQFTLAERGKEGIPALLEIALGKGDQRARIHALNALGQIQRREGGALTQALPILRDEDPEMRTQMAKQLTDTPLLEAKPFLKQLLSDSNDRCAYHAAQAIGHLGETECISWITHFLSTRAGDEPSLRLAGISALEHLASLPEAKEQLIKQSTDPSANLRLALTVVFRRLHWPEIRSFLHDSEPRVLHEAIRAIHDAPIPEALPELARLTTAIPTLDTESARRILNANYRLGTPSHAETLAALAADSHISLPLRLDALAMLAQWDKPAPTDRITGNWHPIPDRQDGPARKAFATIASKIIHDPLADIGSAAVIIAGNLGMNTVIEEAISVARDESLPPHQRASAITALARLPGQSTIALADDLLKSKEESIRIAARSTLTQLDPASGCAALRQALADGTLSEQRAAAASLSSLADPVSEELLKEASDRIINGSLPSSLALDIDHALAQHCRVQKLSQAAREKREFTLAAFRKNWMAQFSPSDPFRDHQIALTGGNAAEGRKIFHTKMELQCLRCHRVENEGVSNVGPDLSGLGQRQKRDYILRAIVDPNADIAAGFEFASITLKDGTFLTGLVESETSEELVIKADGTPATQGKRIAKSQIKTRHATSPMPPLMPLMSQHELRDLIEYISSQ